jgi:hypothetical protein
MLTQIEKLSEDLKRDYPWSNPKFTPFPSGAAMLDVTIGPETYVMEYLPSLRAIGVSRMSSATFGWEGFEHSFESFQSAREFLIALFPKESPCAKEKSEE